MTSAALPLHGTLNECIALGVGMHTSSRPQLGSRTPEAKAAHGFWERPHTPLILCLLRLHGLRSGAGSRAEDVGEAGIAALPCRYASACCVRRAGRTLALDLRRPRANQLSIVGRR